MRMSQASLTGRGLAAPDMVACRAGNPQPTGLQWVGPEVPRATSANQWYPSAKM